MSVRERIVLSAHLLMTIEYERMRRHAPELFGAVEREIIYRELADLETEWAQNDPTASFSQAQVEGRRNRRA